VYRGENIFSSKEENCWLSKDAGLYIELKKYKTSVVKIAPI
jgi:hypothetical protein